jgi:hypothetical protein
MSNLNTNIEALGRILQIAIVDDIVDYPATCFTLIHSESPIPLPEGSRIAVERKPHRGHRMFSSHQVGYDERNDEAYAFALGSCLSDSHRDKEWTFALPFGQLVEVAGRVYRVEDAPNRNVKLVPAE